MIWKNKKYAYYFSVIKFTEAYQQKESDDKDTTHKSKLATVS